MRLIIELIYIGGLLIYASGLLILWLLRPLHDVIYGPDILRRLDEWHWLSEEEKQRLQPKIDVSGYYKHYLAQLPWRDRWLLWGQFNPYTTCAAMKMDGWMDLSVMVM